ncbi:MAG: flavin reductase family protein [Pseudomonadota bacterium]
MTEQAEQRALRDVFGCFATGVCVVTTTSDSGAPVGMTVNSFNSVSLQPPLIAWCIGHDSSCFEHFNGARPFVIHILADDQEPLSRAFAERGGEPFKDHDWHRDASGAPVLDQCPVRLYCLPREHIEAGDHVLIIAAVKEFAIADQAPLVFYRGGYKT